MRIRTRLIILLVSTTAIFVATVGGIFYADYKIDQGLASTREAYSIVTQVAQLNRLGIEVNATGLPRVKRQWSRKVVALRKSIEAYDGASQTVARMLRELTQLEMTFKEIARIYREESSPGFSGDFSKARFYRLNHLTVLLHSLSTMAERVATENVARAKADQQKRDIWLAAIGVILFIAAVVWSLTLWNGIMTPVRRLLFGIHEVSQGDFDYRVAQTGKGDSNELNNIIKSFNSMLDRLQSLTVSRKRLLDTTELERSRIGRELHDGICQGLTAVRLQGEARGQDDNLSTKWLSENLLSLHNEVQRIVKDLRPAMLDELGLIATLRWFAEQNASQIRVKLRVDVEEQDIPRTLRTPIFRIIQESTSNAIRHGRADTIHIQISGTNNELDVSIEDNGQGFAPITPTFGNGLPGIGERVEAEKGQLTIDSAPGRGCCIMISFPLPDGSS